MNAVETGSRIDHGQSIRVNQRHERYGVAREVTPIEAYKTFIRTVAQESGIIMDLNEAFKAHNSVRSGSPIPGRESR